MRMRFLKFLSIIVIFLLLHASSYSMVVRVDSEGGGDAITIQEGITLTQDGDTLLILPGLYYEKELLVDRSILIRGSVSDWPVIDGEGVGGIFHVVWPKSPSFRNLILRNADWGIRSRLEGSDCSGPISDWSADSIVVFNMKENGLIADHQYCRVGEVAWHNITAISCGAAAFRVNDYGAVTASNLVAVRCGLGVHASYYSSASFQCAVFWQNATNSGGVNPVTIENLLIDEPMICDTLGGNFGVAADSPCLPENNVCGALIGAQGLGCQDNVPEQMFESPINHAVGTYPSSVCAADLDGDGDSDIAVANENSSDVSILKNNGTEGFGTAVNYTTGNRPYCICSADFDKDGDLDLATPCWGIDRVSILDNDGTGAFAAPSNFVVGTDPLSICTADFDGDEYYDLAVSNYASNNVSVLKNDGSGSFLSPVNTAVAGRAYSICTADFNGDGDFDLAVAVSSANWVSILLNDGTGTFDLDANYPTAGAIGITAADFDGDEKPDLAVAAGGSKVSILMNQGNGTFKPAIHYWAGIDPICSVGADFDLDGDNDLAVANINSENISFLKNHGDGTFAPAANYATDSGPKSLCSADFDADGDLDLATANCNADGLSILFNILPQTCYAELLVPSNGSKVLGTPILSWEASFCEGNDQAKVMLAEDVQFNDVLWVRTVLDDNSIQCFNTLLENNQDYWWKVALLQGGEWTAYSQPFSFTYQVPVETLPQTVLSLPLDGSELALPDHLSCLIVEGASFYQFDILADEYGTSILHSDQSERNYIRLPNLDQLTNDHTYYWRARAIGSGGEVGPFSDVRSFVFRGAVDPPPKPQLMAPAEGSLLSQSEVPLQWTWNNSSVASPTSFTVQYSTDANFPDISGKSWSLSPVVKDNVVILLPDYYTGTIYWRIGSNNDSNIPVWSETGSFQLGVQDPTVIDGVRVILPLSASQVPLDETLVPRGIITGNYVGPTAIQWWVDDTQVSSNNFNKSNSKPLIISGPELTAVNVLGTHDVELKVTLPTAKASQKVPFDVVMPEVGTPDGIRVQCVPEQVIANGVAEITVTAAVIDNNKKVVITDDDRLIQFSLTGPGTLLSNSANTQNGFAQVQLQAPLGIYGEAEIKANSSQLNGGSCEVRFASDQVDMLVASAERYMAELKSLKLEQLVYPVPLVSPYYDQNRLQVFLDERVRGVQTPAPRDTAALHRFILFERGLMRMYYHDPGKMRGWESGPAKIISGALIAADDFAEGLSGIIVGDIVDLVSGNIMSSALKKLPPYNIILEKIGDFHKWKANKQYSYSKFILEAMSIDSSWLNELASLGLRVDSYIADELRAGNIPTGMKESVAHSINQGVLYIYIRPVTTGTNANLLGALDFLESNEEVDGTLDEASNKVADRIDKVASYTSQIHVEVEERNESNRSYLENLNAINGDTWNIIQTEPPSLSALSKLLKKQRDCLAETFLVNHVARQLENVYSSLRALILVDDEVEGLVGDAFGSYDQQLFTTGASACQKRMLHAGVLDSDIHSALLNNMIASNCGYEEVVRQIIALAEACDTVGVQGTVESWAQVHSALEQDEQLAFVPSIAAASAGLARRSGFAEAYDGASYTIDKSRLKRTMFAADLGLYLLDPLNPASIASLRNSGLEAIAYSEMARDSVFQVTSSVLGDSATSVVICTEVEKPDSIMLDETINITAKIKALGGTDAVDAFVTLFGDTALIINGPDSIPLGTLCPGKDTTVTFDVKLTSQGIAPDDSIGFSLIQVLPGSQYGFGMSITSTLSGYKSETTGTEINPQIRLNSELYPAYPNPFNPLTTIRYYVPSRCRVRIEIFDSAGKLITRLLDREQESGMHMVNWNGTDDRGVSGASGVYFCKLTAGSETLSRKIVLLR